MFFILSKLMAYLLSPLFWVVVLVLTSLLWAKKRRIMVCVSLGLLLLLGNPYLFRVVIRAWEPPLLPIPSIADTNKVVVVLGGYCSYHEVSGRTRFHQSGDRLMQSLLVVKKNNLRRILLSGGTANLVNKERGESAVVKEYLEEAGISHAELLIDSVSRNTHENAVQAALIMDSLKLKKEIVLVTSSWHLYRARKCFEKQGFDVICIGCDSMAGVEKPGLNEYFLPSAGTLSAWEMLIREWIGVAMYQAKGFI